MDFPRCFWRDFALSAAALWQLQTLWWQRLFGWFALICGRRQSRRLHAPNKVRVLDGVVELRTAWREASQESSLQPRQRVNAMEETFLLFKQAGVTHRILSYHVE